MKNELIKLCLDASRGNVLNYSAGQASDAIRASFIEMMGTDKPDFRTFRNHKNEVFAILETVLDQLITDGITQSAFFDHFVEYRDMNLGDSNVFYVEDRTMLTISEVAAGTLNLRRQKLNVGQSFTVATRVYGAKVYGDFLRFVSGRLDWAGLVGKIQEAMTYKMATDIYTNFYGSNAYLPAEFKKAGSFTDANISDLIQHVSVANRYAPVVIAGTRNALKKMNAVFQTSSTQPMSINIADQINKSGIVNVYEGVPLLEIPQVFNPNTFTFTIDDSKLFVLPANTKPIKVVREGQSIIKETNDGNADMSIEHTFLTRYGIATIFNNAYGVYTLS